MCNLLGLRERKSSVGKLVLIVSVLEESCSYSVSHRLMEQNNGAVLYKVGARDTLGGDARMFVLMNIYVIHH